MKNKYLPLGTVCDINQDSKKVMIIGYCHTELNGDLKIMDYLGCTYPEGLLLPNRIVSFNHDDISNIHFLGFSNDEQKRLDSILNNFAGNEDDNIKKAKEFHENNDMFLASNNAYSKLLFDENGVVMLAEDKPKIEYNFDKDGYVINANNEEDIKNPFYKNYSNEYQETDSNNGDWNIFKKIEFDEDGTVIEAQTTTFEEKNNLLNKIEFDENGVVVNDGNKTIEQTQNYKFDENGVLVSDYTKTTKEEKLTSNYKFNEDGTLVSEETYEFDDEGNLVSASNTDMDETLATKPTDAINNYTFDENGVLVSE